MRAWNTVGAAAAAACLALYGGSAEAVVRTFDFSAPTSGTPNPAMGSITLDFDYLTDAFNATAGLTVHSLNFALGSSVGYTYTRVIDHLVIGGLESGASGVASNTNDFALIIASSATSSPLMRAFALAREAEGFIANTSDVSGSISEGGPAPIPLPGAGLLLLGALGVAGAAGTARRHRVKSRQGRSSPAREARHSV